jgi:hypothetical protein
MIHCKPNYQDTFLNECARMWQIMTWFRRNFGRSDSRSLNDLISLIVFLGSIFCCSKYLATIFIWIEWKWSPSQCKLIGQVMWPYDLSFVAQERRFQNFDFPKVLFAKTILKIFLLQKDVRTWETWRLLLKVSFWWCDQILSNCNLRREF